MKQKLRIVKVGGNVINHPEALESFLTDFSALKGLNILVHGGGKRASQMVSDLGLVPKMVERTENHRCGDVGSGHDGLCRFVE